MAMKKALGSKNYSAPVFIFNFNPILEINSHLELKININVI
ncbi:hypothetical protein PTUN_b0579 [Pseudoalteromonas tunicata]|uniref:Uncharacterized protein n=1 Tax=Pseudoalteromonas tunicata D2 TaxID=87626 RepID=A4C4U8_9GAMM|nr:hypothetical protein PTUN_b0579 [Pseudoalteromonas tunicata]EAR30580.1 hypothetical protein PTD2_03386 [Pseudoalteromonas tunicata D2]